MIFNFKPKKIHLDCFTNRNDVHSYFPIVKGEKTYPDWWKKLPKFIDYPQENLIAGTMKSCVGFNDFFHDSISLRLWSDLMIDLRVDETGESPPTFNWRFSDKTSCLQAHDPQQFGDFLKSNEQQHIKLDSPWLFSCKDDIQWLSIGNPWNEGLLNRVSILSGSVSYKYQSATNINLFCRYPEVSERMILPCGMNLLNFFPMSERPVEIHNHLISNEEFEKRCQKQQTISFLNKYLKIKKIVKQNEKKCPFHF